MPLRIDRDPFETASLTAPPLDSSRRLTPEQEEALTRLRTLAQTGTFRVALRDGVTGSGKTEIYLRLSAEMLAAGRRVLMYINNHFSAKAVANAALLKHELGQNVPGEYPLEILGRYPDLAGVVTTSGLPL